MGVVGWWGGGGGSFAITALPAYFGDWFRDSKLFLQIYFDPILRHTVGVVNHKYDTYDQKLHGKKKILCNAVFIYRKKKSFL